MMGSVHIKSILQLENSKLSATNELDKNLYAFKPLKLELINFSGSNCYCQQENCHSKINILSPKPRSGHRIVCDESHVYSFGGYNPILTLADQADLANLNGSGPFWSDSVPLFKELWKFNISTRTWKRMDVEEIPEILASNAEVLSSHLLIVYGGTGVPFGSKCSKDIYICNLKNDSDKFKLDLITTEGNCPVPQYGQAIALIGHHLYTIGGTTGFDYSSDVHRLNLKNGLWEAVYRCNGANDEPAGRYRHEVAFYDNRIYVLGGGTSVESFDFKTIYGFNITTKRWDKVSTRPDNTAREAFPSPRRCHSCVKFGSVVYIIGGFTGQLVLRDIWKLDLNTFTWTKMSKLFLERGTYFHSSSVTPSGKLITFGGVIQNEDSFARTANIYTSWLVIPKLKEICWEAVMNYFPKLQFFSEEKLLSFGLPYEFIKRITPPETPMCSCEMEFGNSSNEPNDKSL